MSRRVTVTEYEMYHVVDDADETVETGNSYECAYERAHELANENDRVYRVKTVRTIERVKLNAIAIPRSRP